MTNESKLSISQVRGYLSSKGVPPTMLAKIITSLVDSAMTEADNMKVDRIYTMVALMLHDVYDLGGDEILKGLSHLDSLFGEFADADDLSWSNEMERLDNECGLIIQSGTGHRIIIEYGGKDTDEITEVKA